MIEIGSPYLTVLISSDYHLSIAVHELFLGFVELPATDAATITESLLENLSQWGIHLDRLQGMAFSGTSNISGERASVQARITRRYPDARYFYHHSSPCLNLVVVASCNKVQKIRNFMTTFEELTFFFSYSAKRREFLRRY